MAQVSSRYTSSQRMGATYTVRALSCKGEFRRAHGQAAAVEFAARAEILQETIYGRAQVTPAAPPRVLTGNLKRGERLQYAGDSYRIQNVAKSRRGYAYAGRRSRMSGVSKRYGHILDSFWPGRAHQKTASRRMGFYRAAERRTWSKRA